MLVNILGSELFLTLNVFLFFIGKIISVDIGILANSPDFPSIVLNFIARPENLPEPSLSQIPIYEGVTMYTPCVFSERDGELNMFHLNFDRCYGVQFPHTGHESPSRVGKNCCFKSKIGHLRYSYMSEEENNHL